MKLRWLEGAIRDVTDIHRYIAQESPKAARQTLERIENAANQLERFPFLGRSGRIAESRELAVVGTPYLIAYRTLSDEVEIVAVIHGARQWPESF